MASYEFIGKKRLPQLSLAAIAIVAAGKIEKHPSIAPSSTSKEAHIAEMNLTEEGFTQPAVSTNTTKTHHNVHIHRHLTPEQSAEKIITPYQRYQWDKVHHCEGNPWDLKSGIYPGGLGMTRANWSNTIHKHNLHYPENAGYASPIEQMNVGRLLLLDVTHEYIIPEQGACNGW